MRLIYPIVLALITAGGAAPVAAQDPAAVAQRLVVRSGLAVQLRSLPKGIGEQTAQLRGKAPDALVAALDEAGREAFKPDPLQQEIERLLPGKLSVSEMQKAIDWLETDVG